MFKSGREEKRREELTRHAELVSASFRKKTSTSKRIAFTLAEVLVTLAIIGVVSSLTIPALIKSYEKSQWIAQYKTTYSIINQATRMIMADNGGSLLGTWETGSTGNQQMYQVYTEHLNIAKRCEDINPGTGGCFVNSSDYKRLNGGSSLVVWGSSGLYSVILSNGASLMFSATQGTSANGLINNIYLDTNGAKGPNIFGKDMHTIYIIVGNNPVKPSGWDQSSVFVNSNCNSTLTGSNGSYCGVRILKNDYGEDY